MTLLLLLILTAFALFVYAYLSETLVWKNNELLQNNIKFERFGWKRCPENKPKEAGRFPVKVSEFGDYVVIKNWNGKEWDTNFTVLAYYELPTFEQEKL